MCSFTLPNIYEFKLPPKPVLHGVNINVKSFTICDVTRFLVVNETACRAIKENTVMFDRNM